MINDKLLKLDGEKIKLYITKNSSLPRLLKNSGSLIVFQDQQREINYIDGAAYLYVFNNNENDNEQKDSINNHIADIRNKIEKDATINKLRQKSCNYLFLGNEVIAGGYGFNSEEQKEKALDQLNSIPNEIYNLWLSILDEMDNRIQNDEIISGKFKDFVSKKSNIGNTDNDLWLDLDYFNPILFKTDKPSNYNHEFSTQDLPKLCNFAEYKDIEVIKTDQYYSCGFFNGNTFVEYKNTVIKDGVEYVPYGSILSKYVFRIDYKENDSDGVRGGTIRKSINITDDPNDLRYEVLNMNTDPNVDSGKIGHSNLICLWASERSISYNNMYLFKPEISTYKPIDYFKYTIYKTPEKKYKKFPLLDDYELYSTQNAIKNHNVNVDVIKIQPTYLCFYNNVINFNLDSDNFPEISKVGKSFNFKHYDNNKLIIDKKVSFTVNFSNKDYHILSFAVPSKYIIKNVYLHNQNGIYNISGLFKIIKSLRLSFNPHEYDTNILCNYNLCYMMCSVSYLKEYGDITIEFEERNEYNDFNQNVITGLDDKGLYDFFENYTHYLRNDEFDGVHWVNGTGEEFCKWLIQDRDNEEIDLLETTKIYYQKKIEDLVD